GSFVFTPLALGRRVQPLDFTMSVADRAGNTIATPVQGRIHQRGLLTGTLAGTLTVEVFDEATFAPIVGATVVVEPDRPQLPAVGRVVGTTGADGRVDLPGLTAARHTVTAIADGHHLTTVVDVPSAFVSMPLRPIDAAAATATLRGTLAFLPSAGQVGLVGINQLEDPLALEVATASTAATQLPPTTVRAGRPLVVHALTGSF